jgi:trk system potassium uptake protein TrkA
MPEMNVIICGAGEVGGHTAEVLAQAGHAVTVIDVCDERLRKVADELDVRTLEGNAASSTVLRQAGAAQADIVIGATDSDEVNLVAASVGRGIGARKSIARLHRRAFFARDLDYSKHFGIDRLICPEYATAGAIANVLRNPAALAIEQFGDGRIDMHEFPVSEGAPAVGIPLKDVQMPQHTRLATVLRGSDVILPDANTRLERGDRIVLVSNSDIFDEARKLFRTEKLKRRKIVLMGGTPIAVWLCRALRKHAWSIRLFETDAARAEELAEKLDWVTVLNANPMDKALFAEEQIALADVFVALLDKDEHNIVGAVFAKAGGVTQSIAVVQQSHYLDLLYHIGVDRSFSSGTVAAKEILRLLDESPLHKLATLAGDIEALEAKVGAQAEVAGHNLRDNILPSQWSVGAIRRDDEVWVPGASDVFQPGDTLLLIGPRNGKKELQKLLSDR